MHFLLDQDHVIGTHTIKCAVLLGPSLIGRHSTRSLFIIRVFLLLDAVVITHKLAGSQCYRWFLILQWMVASCLELEYDAKPHIVT